MTTDPENFLSTDHAWVYVMPGHPNVVVRVTDGEDDALLSWREARQLAFALLDAVARVRVDTTPEPPEAAHYEITVWADAEIGEAGSDALFDRVAAAAHELDEQLFCFSKLVPGPVGAVTAPTEPESTSELIRQAERGFIKATEILGSGASTEPETP